MNLRSILGLCAIGAVGLAGASDHAIGQQKSLKEQLLGTWTLLSHDRVLPDGRRSPNYGPNPHGIAVFDSNGHYIISVMRADRPKYEANHWTQGTAEENKATAQGTMTYFGTYTVNEADRTVTVHIVGSSYPNWDGMDLKRTVKVTADELILGPGPNVEVTWKRAK
jgi:hypothetical protein